MKLTERRKKFLWRLLNKDYALMALDSDYDSNNEKEFRAHYGVGFDQANKIYDALIYSLAQENSDND